VVAGTRDTTVETPGGGSFSARAVAYDSRNDVAVLRAENLGVRPLPQGVPLQAESVAVVGYPENGALTLAAGRIGRTRTVLSEDAYGRGPIPRRMTSFRGQVRPGNSGGPLIDLAGQVVGTVFASRTGARAGYAVPPDVVREELDGARRRVSTGPCSS
jgi:S1-C subfamily serine protease